RALRDQTQPGPNGGSTLRRITVFNDGDRSDYFSGVYPAYIDVGKGTKMTTVENCHAISSGKRPSRLAFSFGSRVAYRACTATGFSYGPYVDNSPATDVTFRDCVWDRHAHCAIHISSNGPVREKVNISNC